MFSKSLANYVEYEYFVYSLHYVKISHHAYYFLLPYNEKHLNFI